MACVAGNVSGDGHASSSGYSTDPAVAASDAESIAKNSARNAAQRAWKAFNCGAGCVKAGFNPAAVVFTPTTTTNRFALRAVIVELYNWVTSLFTDWTWQYTARCNYTWSYVIGCTPVIPPAE